MTYLGEEAPDTTAPVFGGSAIVCDAAQTTALTLTFPAATDDVTARGVLGYALYIGTEPFDGSVPDGTPAVTLGGRDADSLSAELTGLLADTAYYVAVVVRDEAGNAAVLTGGPFRTDKPAPTRPIHTTSGYAKEIWPELSGSWNEYKALRGGYTSAWRAQTYSGGANAVWRDVGYVFGEYYGSHMMTSAGRVAHEHNVSLSRTTQGMFYLVPISYGEQVGHESTALTFIAPESGVWAFGADGLADSKARYFTNTTDTDPLDNRGAMAGVRITVNGEKLWPASGEWYRLAPGESVAIPRLKAALQTGDVLRIEAVCLENAGRDRRVALSASGRMELTEETVAENDRTPPVFTGELTAGTAGQFTVPVTFSTATDDRTAKEELTYRIFVSDTAFDGTLPMTAHAASLRGQDEQQIAYTIKKLSAGKNYYVAVAVFDEAGNAAVLTGGPFLTANIDAGSEFPAGDYAREILAEAAGAAGTWSRLAGGYFPWEAQLFTGTWNTVTRLRESYENANYLSVSESLENCVGVHQGTPGLFWLIPMNIVPENYVGLAFTAPAEGLYTFGADRAAAAIKNTTDAYPADNDGAKAGVRITVDGVRIWPQEADWYALEPGESVDIPTLKGLLLKKGQVLRIEGKTWDAVLGKDRRIALSLSAKMLYQGEVPPDTAAPVFGDGGITVKDTDCFSAVIGFPAAADEVSPAANLRYDIYLSKKAFGTGIPSGIPNATLRGRTGSVLSAKLTGLEQDTAYHAAVVVRDDAGNAAVLTGGPFSTQRVTAGMTFTGRQLAGQIADEVGTEEWSSLIGGYAPWKAQLHKYGVWRDIDRVRQEFAGAYITVNSEALDMDQHIGVERSPLGVFRLSPYCGYTDHLGKSTVALTFTAPVDGVYAFGPDDIDTPDAQKFTNYKNKEFDRADGSRAGIRITKNDGVVWPQTGDWYTLEVGQSVDIPQMEMQLHKGDVIRVEATALTKASEGRSLAVTASVGMRYVDYLDMTAPVFTAGSVAASKVQKDAMTLTWPKAVDAEGSAVTYTVYLDRYPVLEIPSGKGLIAKENSLALTGLTAGTNYYVLIAAADKNGNRATLIAGPFRTAGETVFDREDGKQDITLPAEPFAPNMEEGSAGIIRYLDDTLTVGWNVREGIDQYRVFVFTKTDGGYSLTYASEALSGLSGEHTLHGLKDGNTYAVQVVGYNQQAQPVGKYPAIVYDRDMTVREPDEWPQLPVTPDEPDPDDDIPAAATWDGKRNDGRSPQKPDKDGETKEGLSVTWTIVLCAGGALLLFAAAFTTAVLIGKRKSGRPEGDG